MNKSDEKKYTKDQVDLVLMAKDLATVKATVEEMSRKLEAGYVTKDAQRLLELKHEQLQKQADFTQKIVFGVIGLIAMTVIGAIINLVVKS